MEEMSWLQALILGIIQGLTEFLPISSSGHLKIAETFMGLKSENLTFEILVHAATVLSIITVFGNEIWKLFKGLFKIQWNDETQYIAKLLLSMIPVGIVGVFFKHQVEAVFGNGLILIGCMLLITAALLIFTYYAKARDKSEISFKDAFIIGIAQAIAIFPGLSRSGVTISTGLLLGNKKENVTRFSFLMLIVPVLGETFLDLVKGDFSQTQSGISTSSLIIGFISAYIFGTIACKWMLNIVKKGKLIYFAYYCIAVAIIIITFSIINH